MPRYQRSYFLLIICFLAVVLAVFGIWRWRDARSESLKFRTAVVSRGNLEVSISATGTVEPEEVVDVGAQVAGQIIAFGMDAKGKTVDYGSEVQQGMVLAKIDDSLYASTVEENQAQLKLAKANYKQALAKLAQAERDWTRAQKL